MTACALLLALSVLAWPRVGGRLGRAPDSGAGSRTRGASDIGGAQRRRSGSEPVVTPDQVAVVMDLLAAACRSGRAVDRSLRLVAEVSAEPVRSDLASVSAALAWGVDPSTAWGLAGPAWQSVARTLGLATRAGVAPADALTRAADDLRSESAQALDMATARLGVVMVVPLGLAFLPAFVLLTVVPVVIALARQLLR